MSVWTNVALSGAGSGIGTWAGAYTALTDGNTGTGVKKTSLGGGDYLTYPVTDTTIPSNEVVDGIRWRCTLSRPSYATSVALDIMGIISGRTGLGYGSYAGFTAATLLTGPWVTQNPQGSYNYFTGVYSPAYLVQADINNAALRTTDMTTLGPAATYAATFLELGLDIQTASVHSVTVSAPSGVITDNLTPPIVWSHNDYVTATVNNKALTSNVVTLTTAAAHGFQVGNDVAVNIGDAVFDGVYKILSTPTGTTFTYAKTNANVASAAASGTAVIGDGGAQTIFEVKIFTAAQYGAAGFDPSTSVATWDAGAASGATTITPPQLPNNTTFRAYVRTRKNSAFGRQIVSAWAFSGFSTTATPPTSPTVTATFDLVNSRNVITVQNTSNMLNAQTASIEGGIGAWAANANCSVSASATFADAGTQSLRLSSTAAGNMSAITNTWPAVSVPNAIAAAAGQTYSGSFKIRSAIARTVFASLVFIDAAGSVVQQVNGTSATSTTGGFTTYSVIGSAPTNTTHIALLVNVNGTAGAGEFHYLDTALLAAGGSASSPNLLVPDPSIEGAAIPSWFGNGWFGSIATTCSLTGTNPQNGAQAVLVTLPNAASPGTTGVQFGLGGLTIGATYTISVYVRVPSGGSPRAALIDIFGSTTGKVYITRDTGATTNAYVRLAMTFTATATIHYMGVANDAAATAGQTWNIDSVQLESGTSVTAFSVPGPPAWSPGGRTYAVSVSRIQNGVTTLVRGAASITPDSTGKVALYDYEALRGPSATYSATIIASNGILTTSAVGASPTVTPTNDSTWWLKAVGNPALNEGSVKITGEPSESREEEVGVFRLSGRSDTVVVSGQTYGDDIEFEIAALSALEFEEIKNLVTHQGTILLQEPFVDSAGNGIQRYIRIVERSWKKSGVLGSPKRFFSVKAVEVGKGY